VSPPRPSRDLFVTRMGTPRLVDCAVLFLDLLGVRAMTRGSQRQVARRLRDLERAVSRQYRNYLQPDSRWPAAFFSDTLVLAAPVDEFGGKASAVDGLLLQAALLQAASSAAGSSCAEG
jgi:hypothetical protein